MSDSLRIGLVGTGFMAGTHTKTFASLDGVEIAGVCSLTRELAQTFIGEHGLAATAYPDFQAMLAGEKLDALCIAVPPSAHNGEIVAALDAGLHVLAEKPLALHLDDARIMAEAAARAGVVTQVDYHFRFKQSVERLAAAMADGSAGRPTLFTGRFWVNMDGPPWWRDLEQSGGQVYEQCIHLYNLAKALCGDPVSVSGQMANLLHSDDESYTIEDTSVGTIRFANGSLAVITGSNCAVPERFFADFRAAFENVTVDFHTTGQDWVEPDHAIWYQDGERERIAEPVSGHQAAAIDFVEAIREGRPARCPMAEAYEDLRMLCGVIASAHNGGQPLQVGVEV